MSHKITFREKGQGPVLLLLHGYGGSPNHWEAIGDRLSSQYRVVTLSLGHLYMSSDKLFFSVQVERLIKFIEEHFPNEKIFLGGFSFGGALAWGVTSQRPDLVEKLMLVNPMVTDPIRNFLPKELRFFFSIPMNLKSIYFALSTPMGQRFLKRSAQIFRDERSEGAIALENLKGRKLQFVAHMIHHFAWILRSENWNLWNQKLQAYNGECMIVFDQEDLLFNQEAYRKFAQLLGCEDLHVLSGAGHLAIKTQPEKITMLMKSFLKTSHFNFKKLIS